MLHKWLLAQFLKESSLLNPHGLGIHISLGMRTFQASSGLVHLAMLKESQGVSSPSYILFHIPLEKPVPKVFKTGLSQEPHRLQIFIVVILFSVTKQTKLRRNNLGEISVLVTLFL